MKCEECGKHTDKNYSEDGDILCLSCWVDECDRDFWEEEFRIMRD